MKKFFIGILEWIREPYVPKFKVVYFIYFANPFTRETNKLVEFSKKDAMRWKINPFVYKIKRKVLIRKRA